MVETQYWAPQPQVDARTVLLERELAACRRLSKCLELAAQGN